MKEKTGKKRKGVTIAAGIGFAVCSLALLYPVISNAWNSYVDSKLIDNYNTKIEENIDTQDTEQMLADAQAYNATLASSVSEVINGMEYEKDDTYESLLAVDSEGMMGYIEIPCIDCTEPIYHYSTDEVLSEGIGHIHGSSLPVGGESTHAVLTGHRGLPGQKFFTDLDELTVGKKFYIHMLDQILAYEVYDVQTVLPEEVSSLKIEQGQDIVTLVTCTPYGVNSHRLLVTGKRVPYDGSLDDKGHVTTEQHQIMIDPAVCVFAGFILFIVLVSIIRRRSRKKAAKKQKE